MANVDAGTTFVATDFNGMRIQLVADAVAALVVLLVATALSVFKPQGLTRFVRTQMNSAGDANGQISAPRWVHVFGIIVIVALVAVVLIKHLASGGLAHHMR